MKEDDFVKKMQEGLKHAFSVENVEALTEAEHRLVNMAAKTIIDRGMEAPALMLLETCRPLGTLTSGAAAFLEPIVASLVPAETLEAFLKLMERKNAIEMLIESVEKESGKAVQSKGR